MSESPKPSPVVATPVETAGMSVTQATQQQIEVMLVEYMATVLDYSTKLLSATMGLTFQATQDALQKASMAADLKQALAAKRATSEQPISPPPAAPSPSASPPSLQD